MTRRGKTGYRQLVPLQQVFDWLSLSGQRRWLPRIPAFDVVLEFAADWYFSRPRRLFLAAIPALVTGGLGLFVGSEAVVLSKERLIQEHEQRSEQFRQTGDRQGRELSLRALAALDAENPSHRLRLGLLYESIGRLDAARQQMRLATEMRTSGVAEACLWLARDRLRTGTDSENREEAETLLLEALLISPRDTAVRLELAAFFEMQGEMRLAEHSLAEAAAVNPRQYPGMIQWLLRNQRPGEQIQRAIREAVRALDEELKKTPNDEAARIALSEVYVVDGNFAAGERILKGADSTQELSGAMRGAWSSLRLLQARSLLQQSPLNGDAALPLLAESLAYDPRYAEALELAEVLVSSGLRFPADALEKPLQQLRAQRQEELGNWQTESILCRMELLAGYVPEVPEPTVSARSASALRQRLEYVELLQRCGERQESESEAEQLLSELQAHPEGDRGSRLTAECLLLLQQPREALAVLRREMASVNGRSAETSPVADRQLLARVSLAAFDAALRRMVTESSGESGRVDLIELLRPAFDDPASVLPALERLVELWSGQTAGATVAHALLCELRAEGRFVAEIPSMLGVHAVRQGRYAEAVLFLREADAAAGGADAAIQNNLAVSLVRADPSHAGEAMELIDAALEQYPGHPDLLATRGEVLAAQGLWAEAVESLAAALPARRGDAELRQLLEKASLAMRNQQRSAVLERPGLRLRDRAQRGQPRITEIGSDVPSRP